MQSRTVFAGWGPFKPDNPGVKVASDYRNDCIGCPIPAREPGYRYVRAYPTLRGNDPAAFDDTAKQLRVELYGWNP